MLIRLSPKLEECLSRLNEEETEIYNALRAYAEYKAYKYGTHYSQVYFYSEDAVKWYAENGNN